MRQILVGAKTRTEGGQKRYTAFATASGIASVFPGKGLCYRVPGLVVRGGGDVDLSVAHLVKFISKFLCLLSSAVPTLSLTHLEEIKEVCLYGERRYHHFA